MKRARKQKKSQTSTDGKTTWYQRFALFFFDKSKLTLVIWALLLMFGAGAYTTWLQREGFPDVAVPISSVSGTYTVDDREKVDEEVVQPVTEVIQDVDGVTEVQSEAHANYFSIQVMYEEELDSETGNDRIETAVTDADVVPEEAETTFSPVFASSLTPEGDDLLIAVAAPEGMPAEELQDKADALTRELQEGGDAEVMGAEEVRTMDFFQTTTNPVTQEEVTQQTQFDWTAAEEDGTFASSAMVAIQTRDDVDALELYDEVAQRLETVQKDDEFADVQLSIAGDFATMIRAQTSSLESNMLVGLLAVIIVSFAFISWRASIVSALSMVTTLALTVGGLYIIGESLNTITLFALILTLGLIVDDATIVVEAIDKRRRKETSARDTVAFAIKKIAMASAAGTLTTVLAFAPLLFIGGIMGDFIQAIPVTIIMSLVISLFVSLSLVPFLARYTVLRGRIGGRFTNPINTLETKIANGLSATVRVASTSYKKGVMLGVGALLISAAAIAGSFYYGDKLPFNIFPSTKDSDMLMVSLDFAPNTTIEQAKIRSEEVNRITTNTIGEYIERASYYGSGNAESAQTTIMLTPHQERDVTAPELAEDLNEELSGVVGVEVETAADGGPAPAGAFTMQLRDGDGVALAEAAAEIREFLHDREIERPDGTTATITSAQIEGADAIARTNGERYVEISAEFDDDDVSALVVATQELVRDEFDDDRLGQYGLTADDMVFDVGQEAENQESFAGMMIAFPILLALMYILLATQLRSFSQPLLIFLAIPFSLFGVTLGLFYTDNAFSFFVMLGIFALMGIAVNNTILLTDYANQERRAGKGRVEAMASALHERFRPLVVTTLTTIVALLPLMLTDPFWESLAATLVFGLLSSTVLVVLAFPYYYLGVELLRKTFTRKLLFAWIGLLLAFSIGLPWIGVDAMITMWVIIAYIILTLGKVSYDIIRGRQRRA